MKFQTFTLTVEFTHSLGNYSNVKPSLSVSGFLEEGDDLDKVMEHTRAQMLRQIHFIIIQAIFDHRDRQSGPKLSNTSDPFYEG